MEPNVHSTPHRQVSQLVFKQIADYAIQQWQVSIYNHIGFKIDGHVVMAFSHGWLVNINELPHDFGQIDGSAIHVKRAGLGFGKIQRGVEQQQEPIQFFDRWPNRVTPLSADSSVPRIKVTGLFRS
jgi:hypothetical protein